MCTLIMGLVALALLALSRLTGRKSTIGQAKCPFAFFSKRGKASDNDSSHEPGLGWHEQYIDGTQAAEAEFVQQAMQDIHTIQSRNKESAQATTHMRAFHAKIQGGIENAEFRILDSIPDELRVSFLQPGKSYKTSVRFSNASGKVQADTAKDLRGIALRVTTASGEQDFLATNGSASHARDARQFIEFAKATAGSRLLLLPRLFWNIGFFETSRMFKTVIQQVRRKVSSLCSETYFSRSPFAFGKYALKFQITPKASADLSLQASDSYLRDDLIERLKRGPVVFDFQVQLFLNEKDTPIEDGSCKWTSPLVTIAQLVIPQQDLTSPEAASAQQAIEQFEFNPWNCADGIRPLGSLNRARRLVYKASVELRKGQSTPSSSQGTNNTMTDSKNVKKGRCPFHFGSPSNTAGGGFWRPRSSRQGIGPFKYVYWNAFYWVLETLNRGLSRNPFRKVSWDKWPPFLGLFYLIAKIRFNRSNALTDPYDYAANDSKPLPEPGVDPAKHHYTADGSYVLDNDNPQMGTPGTRFGSNIPPKKVRPDVENMTPSAREVGKLRWRRLDPETGKEIVIPAMILNDLAGGWIQFEFHNFGGNTKRDPVGVCPHMLARDPKENWPGNVAIVDRTTKDPTRVTDNGRPTPINEKTVAWIQGQIYGSNEGELNGLRSLAGGKLTVDADLRLPEDPNKPGIDKVGFNNNYNPLLSFLHWLFVQEHNAIAEHYAYFHADWDDEQLFQMARKVNVAQIARIHTIQWTEDLLQHPTLQLGMHADWYGFLGQKVKMYLMRLAHRNRFVNWLLKPFRANDMFWGMPGSRWEHHDGPFQVPKHFRMVYRLHEMVLGEHEIVEPGTDRLLDRIQLLDFVHHNTRPVVAKYGYETLAWSFVRKSCGALTLHNFPRALTQFENQQDGVLTDLAERDIFRERTDGTGTYNEFRLSVGEPPVESFMELTGGDAEMARELEQKYEGDVNKVDAGIGILVEPKPAGFALGFCQFYQFVLNAPRRVKSNRHLTEGFTYKEYGEGLDWVEHGGGMLGAMSRHLPGIRPQMEGVLRAFAPWPETETFPLRQLNKTHEDTANVFKSDLRSLLLALLTAFVAVASGAVALKTALLLLSAMLVIPSVLTVSRMLAMRFMQQCWQKCYTDKRAFMFGTLTRAEESIERACRWGRLQGLAVMGISAGLCLAFAPSYPLVGLLLALVALSGYPTYKWSNAFALDAQVLKVALRNRMREELPVLETRNAGAVDMDELERIFRSYAPGRDFLTAYDLGRMHEGERVKAAREGIGNCFSRYCAEQAARKQWSEILHVYADRVVEEDRKLVPAISKEMVVRYLEGSAQAQVRREHEEGDRDPSPIVHR